VSDFTEKLKETLGAAASVCRAVLGVPDYERYLAHVRVHHPDETPLSREEFFARRQTDRYERPGSRCC
jgi:uncharacterized short protein YbdD (DUF466 family)